MVSHGVIWYHSHGMVYGITWYGMVAHGPSICEQDYAKSNRRLSLKFCGLIRNYRRTNPLNLGYDLDLDLIRDLRSGSNFHTRNSQKRINGFFMKLTLSNTFDNCTLQQRLFHHRVKHAIMTTRRPVLQLCWTARSNLLSSLTLHYRQDEEQRDRGGSKWLLQQTVL